MRVFRVFRLLKTNTEIRLIVNVLWKSVNTLFYNLLFFLIFLYLFTIIGVTLFKLPESPDPGTKTYQNLQEYVFQFLIFPEISPIPTIILKQCLLYLEY